MHFRRVGMRLEGDAVRWVRLYKTISYITAFLSTCMGTFNAHSYMIFCANYLLLTPLQRLLELDTSRFDGGSPPGII